MRGAMEPLPLPRIASGVLRSLNVLVLFGRGARSIVGK